MDSAFETAAIIAFGRFQVLPRRRELLADGRPVKLGGLAFDTLVALIEARGAVVGKDALMARLWPDRVVEENNLQVQIVALRKAFGEDRGLIRTVSRRGYQFTAEIRIHPAGEGGFVAAETRAADQRNVRPRVEHGAGSGGAMPAEPPPTNLPEPVSELIGREEEVGEILNLAAAHRLVTLTGAGGIGKTRVALALARELQPHFTDGVWLAEFSPLTDPGLVPAMVAAAVGIDLGGGAISVQRVAQLLASRRLLLVLDTCEHVIAVAAALAEALLRAGSAVRIIATSREPLQIEGEWIYPVPPLAMPVEDSADDAPQYGAVRLFIERVRAAEPRFVPNRRITGTISAICRRLDGIPLAIELAAARAATLGIEELAVHLDDRFRLLSRGRRTALPRHQTMRATLDWSYGLLAELERVLLRRLAIFSCSFSLEAASMVAASPELSWPDAIEGLLNLVGKSLVVAGVEGGVARYRLLDTTRAYALEKLAESGERPQLAWRHAKYCQDFFERAETEWETRPTAEWLADYGRHIDDLRAALDWAFSPDGDASIGVALTAAAVPLWMHLSLLEECRSRVERALAALGAGANRDARQDMKLCAALGGSLLFTKGPMVETEFAWTRTLTISEGLADPEYQLRALWGLWVHRMNSGEFGIGLGLAQRFHSLALAQGDPSDLAIADRMIGVSLHYRGDQTDARRHIEHMLAHYVVPARRSPSARFVYDQKAVARVALARIIWLQGFPDQAWSIAQSNVEDALALNSPVSLCFTLAEAACPVAFFVGDLVAAERYVTMLLDRSAAHALPIWQSWGHRFEGTLLIWNGEIERGLQLLRTSLEQLPEAGFQPRFTWFLGQLAQAFGRAGRIAEGSLTIDEALARSERNEDRWCLAELLRIKGDLLLLEAPGTAAAEDLFRQALDVARRQGTLSWGLRAATSLARVVRDRGRRADAVAILQPVYDRFIEGFDTADLKSARALLER
jgi:predicted ATPase/DNA-binding winged helix-turn-helix (wHTH) protein